MIKYLLIFSLMSAPLFGADVEPVVKTNITNEAEDKTVEVIASDVNRLAVDVVGVTTNLPGAIDDLLIINATNGGSPSLIVDGSSTPVVFTVEPHATKQTYINTLRFFGGCNGIKFTQFFCKNNALTTGIEVEIKANNKTFTFPVLKTTEDFKNKFAISITGESFRIDVQSGSDQFLAIIAFSLPIMLSPQGTFGGGNDDYIKVTIQDDITGSTGGNLADFEFLASGYLK